MESAARLAVSSRNRRDDGPRGDGDSVVSRSFFFQAEDGIRDLTVTGVQTCALPISLPEIVAGGSGARGNGAPPDLPPPEPPATISGNAATVVQTALEALGTPYIWGGKIGRASCRERV